ncbi:induced under oxygen limitation [Scheffersomyces xylosifermentans]|uniref:induced under oxygen limitation n=1 Tax=Scheffersomyces xylosifermentans TaxID=1304137 RepID=UPI00315C717B
MSSIHHRKCSLAIESTDSRPANNPLNAYLVYKDGQLVPKSNSPESMHLFKSHSLPNLNEDTDQFKRRVSLCDLNNFNDELRNIARRNSSSASSNPTARHLARSSSNLIEQSVSESSPFDEFYLYSFEDAASRQPPGKSNQNFRNHHRRNSIALKFENPKIIG